MDFGISGKVALVSGASQGIGRAVAVRLAAEGCDVMLVARGAEALRAAATEADGAGPGRIAWVAADMTTESGVTAAVDACKAQLGPVDIAVTNVAGPKALGFDSTGDEAFFDAYRALVMSVVWLARRVLADMRTRRWGRIVNIGSDCVKDVHRELPLVLANVNRAAALGLLKSLSDEVAGDGITVNNIGVGGILTGNRVAFHAKFAAERGLSPSEVENANATHIPVGRFGSPDELAATVAFLCSVQAAFVTGETIAVNGGRSRTLL